MFAAREELFGREMRKESEDCPGQEGGDFLDVFQHPVGVLSQTIRPIAGYYVCCFYNYNSIFLKMEICSCTICHLEHKLMKILGYIFTMYHFVLLQKRALTKRTTVREARQIKKYLFFFSFTSANKLEVEDISQFYTYNEVDGDYELFYVD